MAGSRSRSVHEEVAACTTSVSYSLSSGLFTNKAAAHVMHNWLRHYEHHGSRRDSEISTEQESVDLAGATPSLAAKQSSPAKRTPGIAAACSEDDSPDPSCGIPTPPSRQPCDGDRRSSVRRRSSRRKSQKIRAASKDGAAIPCRALSPCRAGYPSRSSWAETRHARQQVHRVAGGKRKQTQQHGGPLQQQQDVRQLEKQAQIRERLLQRRRGGMRRCRVSCTETPARSTDRTSGREGPLLVSAAVCFAEDTVPRAYSVPRGAAAHADTAVKTSVSSAAADTTREAEAPRDVTGATPSGANAGQAARAAAETPGREGRASRPALSRGLSGCSASCASPVVAAAAQRGTAKTLTIRSTRTVDAHEAKGGGHRALSTPSPRETPSFSSLLSSALSSSFFSGSSSVRQHTGRSPRLRPLQPRPTVSFCALDAPASLLRPAAEGDVCNTSLSVVPASVCYPLACVPSDCIPRTVDVSSSGNIPGLHQLQAVEQLPLFRRLVAEAEHAHWERRQRKLKTIRQQQQQHAHLRRLVEQQARQSSSSSSLPEKDSECDIVCRISPVKKEGRVPKKNPKSCAECCEDSSRRRMCTAATLARAVRVARACVAAPARTPTFSTLRHVLRMHAASRTATGERQPRHAPASFFGEDGNLKECRSSSISSAATSRDSVSNESHSKRPSDIQRRMAQRAGEEITKTNPVSGSLAANGAPSAQLTTGCSSDCSKHRECSRSLSSAVSTKSGFQTLEAWEFEGRPTVLTRAAHEACVSHRKVGAEPRFHSCPPASSERRHHLLPCVSSEAGSFYPQPFFPHSASRLASVAVDAPPMSSVASASTAAPGIISKVPAAAAGVRTESGGLTAPAETTTSAVSDEAAAKSPLFKQASSVNTSCADEKILAASRGGAAYMHLSSNDSRSASTSWGGDSGELLGSYHVTKQEKRESQQLLSLALCSSSAHTEALGISCPRERYWELYHAYQRRIACSGSPLSRTHRLQQQHEQQQVQRQQRRHVEQQRLEGPSALPNEDKRVLTLRAAERIMGEEKNSGSSVSVAGCSSRSSLAASACCEQEWKSRHFEPRTGAAAQKGTRAAAGLAGDTQPCSAAETEGNTCEVSEEAAGAAGISSLPFQRKSRSPAASPAGAAIVAEERRKRGRAAAVDRCLPRVAVTPARLELSLSDTAAAREGEKNEVQSLKKKQAPQRAGHEQLLQYFHQQLLEHFQLHPLRPDTATGGDGKLCAGYPDSYIGATLERENRLKARKRQTSSRYGKAEEAEKKWWTAFSRDLLVLPADECLLQSHSLPSPVVRLQLACQRKAAAGRRSGIGAACAAAAQDDSSAAVESSGARPLLYNAAAPQSTAGTAEAAAATTAAPTSAAAGERGAVSPSAVREEVILCLTPKAAPGTRPQSPFPVSPPPLLSQATVAGPPVVHTAAARAFVAGQLNAPAGMGAPSVTSSLPSSAAASLPLPGASAVAASSVGATWPAASVTWPAVGCTATPASPSSLRLESELKQKGISMPARLKELGIQRRTLQANDKMYASSVNVVSSRDRARSSNRSKTTVDNVADTVASVSGQACTSPPFAAPGASRAAVATEYDAHFAKDDRSRLPPSAVKSGSSISNRGVNGMRNTGLYTGSRSSSGSRTTSNRTSDSGDRSSTTRKSSAGYEQQFQVGRSSKRSAKGQSSSDKKYVLLFSHESGDSGINTTSVVASDKLQDSSFPLLGGEVNFEQRRRDVSFPRRMPAAEAGAAQDGKEAAGALSLISARQTDYSTPSSENRAADPGTEDSWLDFLYGTREQGREECSAFASHPAKKRGAERGRGSPHSSFFFPDVAEDATENTADRGFSAEREGTALQLQESKEGSRCGAPRRLGLTQVGAYELQGTDCSPPAFHAVAAQGQQLGAWTAAAETGSSTAGEVVEAAAAAVPAEAEAARVSASVSSPPTATVCVGARARTAAPAASAAKFANATRTAAEAARPALWAASVAAHPVATRDIISARTARTAFGLEMRSAANGAAVAGAVPSLPSAASIAAVQREAVGLEATDDASSAAGGNLEAAEGAASDEEVSEKCSRSGALYETGSCRSRERGHVLEYGHEKGSFRDETHDNERSSEDQPHKCTEGIHKGAQACSDPPRPAAPREGMTVSSVSATDAVTNFAGSASALRHDCTRATYPGVSESNAHSGTASVSSAAGPAGGGAAAGGSGVAVGTEIPGDDRVAADIEHLPRRHPVPSEMSPAFSTVKAYASTSAYSSSSSAPHIRSGSLLVSGTADGETASERPTAAAVVPSCKAAQNGSAAIAAPCLAAALTAHPAGPCSSGSLASSFSSVFSAAQQPQKRQRQPPPPQQCLKQSPAPRQHLQQQTQQQQQLRQQSRLLQQRRQDPEQHPQPQQHPQQEKQQLQEQSPQRQAQGRQLEEKLQSLQQPFQEQFSDLQRSPSQQPQQQGWHAFEKPEQERTQLRRMQQQHQQHSMQQEQQPEDELYRPLVMRAALSDSLTATQMSTSLFVCSNCSSRSDKSRDSTTTAAATRSTGSPLSSNPSPATRSSSKAITGATVPGSTHVPAGTDNVSASAADLAAAASSFATADPAAGGCARVSTSTKEVGLADRSLVRLSPLGWEKNNAALEQQQQIARRAAQKRGDETAVPAASSARTICTAAATQTAVASPAEAAGIAPEIPHLASASAVGGVRQMNFSLDNEHERPFRASKRDEANSAPASKDSITRSAISASLASPSSPESSSEGACVTQLLKQLLILVLQQPRSSAAAPFRATAESEAREQHALEKRTAAAAAGAALTGTVAAACRPPAAGAGGQFTSSSACAHCKTSSRNCSPAESTLAEDVKGAPVPTTSGNLAATELGSSTGTCAVGDNNSGKCHTGLHGNNSGNAFAARRRSSNIDGCTSAVAGTRSSGSCCTRAEPGRCDAGLAAMRTRPSSPPPRPGGTVISEATAAADKSSLHGVGATYPDAEAATCSTAAAAVSKAVVATRHSVARAALNATTAAAPTAVVVGRPDFKGVAEVACQKSAAIAPVPILLPVATGSAGIRTGRVVSAMESSTLASKEGGRQSITTRTNTPRTDTAAVTQLQRVPGVEFSCSSSCSNSSVTRPLAAQQQLPSSPAFREYGRFPLLVEGGGTMRTDAFGESRDTRRADITASAGTVGVSCAVATATADGDAAGASSGLLAAGGSTDAAIPEPGRLSRTLGASADASSEEPAGAEQDEHNFTGSPPAVRLRETHAAAAADALGGPRATDNVGCAGSQDLTESQTAVTAEDLLRGVADGFRESCKQTYRLRSLLLASLVGMLSLDESMLLPLLPASPSNNHRVDCSGTSEGGSGSCSGTAVASRRQNSESSSSSRSCSACSSDDPQGGKCADRSTPLSLLLSSAAAGVAAAAAGDWMRTLPPDLQEAAAVSISLLRQWSTSTQLSCSASPYTSLHSHRQQQLQGPRGRESLSMRQQLPPPRCQNQLAVGTEYPQRPGQQQQSRQQQRPSQREDQCDSDGLHAHQQHKVAREIFHSTPVLQNLQLTVPCNATAATPVPMAPIPDAAAVYDDNSGVTGASSTVSPGAAAATAAPTVSDARAFSPVVEPSRYACPGGERSLSLSQLQQTSSAGSLPVQEWEGQQLLPEQQHQEQLQLKQRQVHLEQEAPALPPEIQRILREGRSSDCAAVPQSCCPTSAGLGVKQLAEDERSGVANMHMLLHAQQLQKLQLEQQLGQGKHQVEQIEAGVSRRTLQGTCLDEENRHPQAPQQSVKRQDEALTLRQPQGRQQHHQHPCDRHHDRKTQLHSFHRLLQRLLLEHTLHNRMEQLSETEATATEEKALSRCSIDGLLSHADVALMESQQRAAGKGGNKRSSRTKSCRSTNSMERRSRRRHPSSKGRKCTSTGDSRRKNSIARGRRRRGSSSRGETSSTGTRTRTGSRMKQKSSRSTSAATHTGLYWDSHGAPSAKRTGRADHCVGEESTYRIHAAPLARVRSTSDTAEAGAVSARNAGVPVAESARQKTYTAADAAARLPVPPVTTSGRCAAVVAAAADPPRLSSSVASTHRTDGDLENRLRRQYKNSDVTTVDTLRGSGAVLADTTFAAERRSTMRVAAADAAARLAQHRRPQVSPLYPEADGAHLEHALHRQQQRMQSERQQQLQRCQRRTRPKTQYSPSPRQQHGEDHEGKGTKKNASKKAKSCRGHTKSWKESRENMSTGGAGHDSAMHFWNKEAPSHVGDSSSGCRRRSRHRQDSGTQTRSSSTEVPCSTSYGNRSTIDSKHSDRRTKRSTSHQHRNSSRPRHSSSSSKHIRRSRRKVSFTRTRRTTKLKKRLLATSTSPGEADAAEQLLPVLRKHLQQQRELHEELQQVEQQLAGLDLLNSLTAFSGGVSCSVPTGVPAETEAERAAAREGRSAHSDKHCAEPRSRRGEDTSNSCGSDKRACATSTCEENGRPSSSRSGGTSYYTPVSVSTASAAAVQRGEGTGSNQVMQPRSLNSSQFDAAEEAAGHSCTFPCCTRVVPTAEACHLVTRSISKDSSRSASSSRSDSCERIMGKELLELSGGRLGLATVKQQLREACFPSKTSCNREKSPICKWDLSEEAGCFSGGAFSAAGGADCVATFSGKVALQQLLCAGQAAVANKSCSNSVKEEVRRLAHLDVPDEQTAATAEETQMKRRAVLQGLQSVEQQQQRFSNGDALQKRNVDCPFFRRGKVDDLLLSAAEVSGDEATHWLDPEVTQGCKHRANTRRQRTSGRWARAWLDYRSAGSSTCAVTSRAGKQQHEPRQNQQQRLKHRKRLGRNLQTSMLLDSETDGVTERSMSEQPSAHSRL